MRRWIPLIAAVTSALFLVGASAINGVTPTGDVYQPRNSDAPDALQYGLQNAPQGSTVDGYVFWDRYRDLVSNVVLTDKQTGMRLAQWNL